jgi:hypothetical protein
MRLPDALATGRSYYWRARADDGANASPYSPAANFRRLHADRHRGATTGFTRSERDRHQSATDVHLPQRRRDRAPPARSDMSSRSRTRRRSQIRWPSGMWRSSRAARPAPVAVRRTVQSVLVLARGCLRSDHAGPWSETRAFSMPEPPPLPPVPVPGPIPSPGRARPCRQLGALCPIAGEALVQCVHAAVNPARRPKAPSRSSSGWPGCCAVRARDC